MNANAQEGKILIEIGAGAGQADGLLEIPFVRENGGTTSRPSNGDDTATLWALAVGYQLIPRLYVELGFASLGEYGADREVGGLRPSAEIDEWRLGVRYEHPLSDRLVALWQLGATRASVDSDRSTIPNDRFGDTSTEPIPDEQGYVWGAGLLWSITKSWRVGVSYARHELDRTDLGSLTVSVSTRILP